VRSEGSEPFFLLLAPRGGVLMCNTKLEGGIFEIQSKKFEVCQKLFGRAIDIKRVVAYVVVGCTGAVG
jgi:hypothetical protein